MAAGREVVFQAEDGPGRAHPPAGRDPSARGRRPRCRRAPGSPRAPSRCSPRTATPRSPVHRAPARRRADHRRRGGPARRPSRARAAPRLPHRLPARRRRHPRPPLRAAGHRPRPGGRPARPGRGGAPAADVLLLCGGVSMGEFDFVEGVLAELGCEPVFDAVAIQPGKPLVFAVHPGGSVFGLPGNPASVMVSFWLFVRPALRRLMGFDDSWWGRALAGDPRRAAPRRRPPRPLPAGGGRAARRRAPRHPLSSQGLPRPRRLRPRERPGAGAGGSAAGGRPGSLARCWWWAQPSSSSSAIKTSPIASARLARSAT